MREVERYTIYEPPLALQATGTRAPDEFPVNLLYAFNSSPEIVIIARVQFTGLDFSNRSGNYFAHSLLTDNPGADMHEVLPVELWNASFWQSRQSDRAELPPLLAAETPHRHGLQSIQIQGERALQELLGINRKVSKQWRRKRC